MTDIRKRTGTKGTTYQVRYANPTASAGYSYKTFTTAKEARAFRESGAAQIPAKCSSHEQLSVSQAVDDWLDICEKEGLNGREPVTNYTLKNYKYRASFIKNHAWGKNLRDLTSPDVVDFRSSLLRSGISRDLASKVLSSFHSVMKEMALRDRISGNCAAGVSVSTNSRYDEPLVIPTKKEIKELLSAADDLANATNQTIAKPWQRYRPMLYLAVDSGMRPQEYLAAAKSALTETGIKVERAIAADGSEITVTKTVAGRRSIDLSDETLAMVRYYADKIATANAFDLIFPDESGKWQDRRNWQRRGFNVACEKAGLMVEQEVEDGSTKVVPKFRPYDLRHFFASYHIAQRTNLKKLQKMMGHKDIETTLNVYGHLLEDEESTTSSLVAAFT